MPSNRFFIESIPAEGSAFLTGEELRHLFVMRPKLQEKIELADGRGRVAEALVSSLSKQAAELTIVKVETFPPPKCQVILAQAITHMNHLEWLVEKATELGVAAIWLFPGEQSDKKELSSNQQQRLKNISIAALKQSGAPFLPPLEMKDKLAKWQKPLPPLFYGDLNPEAPYLLNALSPLQELAFIVGPERGFSEREKEILSQLPAQGTRLHPHILRTETAAIVSLGIIQHWLSSLKNG
ncbi:MAG: putative methyltransferase [Chlamydiales bacterium]|jgi:16S rRNA (uracil1498-N3)-methyltransferase|nr:putative methyltransferase [Chlamydiales bacterium]